MRSHRFTHGALRAIMVLACGCATPPPLSSNPHPANATAVSAVERFLPLTHNTVQSFTTENEQTGERGLLIVEISRPRPGYVHLKMGSRIRSLELIPDGIRLITGGYLLKAPLVLGATWGGSTGEVKVSAVDATVKVPAGTFVGCLETTESSQGPMEARQVVTTYCPDVGIVSLIAQATSAAESGAEPGREVALLKSFGARVDLGVHTPR